MDFRNKIKKSINGKLGETLPLILLFVFGVVFAYSSIKENIVTNIQVGYAIPNSVVNSAVVALDGFINPDGVIASAADVTQKVQNGEGVLIQDVFRRCKIQSENRVSDAYFQLYDTKAGVNNGDPIGDGSGGNEIRKYLRYDNRNSLDLEASQYVVILMDSSNPDVVANAIRTNNEQGFVPIIRLGVIDMGVFPFDLSNNADSMVDYFTRVGDALMNENKGYRAVLSFGPNEPVTGGSGLGNLAAMGLSDYTTMVQRENQAASRLQKYRVINGGVFWFGPAIFNGTATYTDNGREYSEDIFKHLYIDNGDSNTDKNYWNRKSIDPDLFDVMLANIYKNVGKSAYDFYKDYGLKEYVDKRSNLVTIVTEFGIDPYSPGLITEDLKPDFKAFYDDPKVEGINWFRALKDKPSLPPAPSPEQSASLEQYIKFLEQSNKATKKISLKNDSWLNCNLSSTLYKSSSNTSSGNSGVLNPTAKGGLNEGDSVGGGDGTMAKAKSVGLTGYSLGIAYSPSDADAAIQFINKSRGQGFTPIIRLCVDQGQACGFNIAGGNASDLISFYNKVSEGAGGSFIGIVGPNEPKTEMDAFGTSNINDAVRAAVNAVQGINKRGKMLAAPAAFNLETDELEIYKTAFSQASFDVLIGNAYNHNGKTADQWADSAISFAKSNGLKVIITETGTIAGSGGADFAQSVGALCSKVDGFLLFRVLGGSADGSYENKPTPFSDDQLKAIASACSGGGTTTVQVAETTITGNSQTANTCTSGLADDKILFVGDSITNELVSKFFPTSKNLGLPGASTAWFVPGKEPANDNSGQLISALGDSNYTSLILMLGTNDCGGLSETDYRNNLTAIINLIKSNSSIKIYLSTIPDAHKACSAEKISLFNTIVRDVQSSTGVNLRDLGTFTDSDLRDDRHLTDAAYQRIANKTRELLGATCSGSIVDGNNSIGAIEAPGLALACGTEPDKPADFYKGKNAAALRVKCEGNTCTTQMVNTVDVEAPFKLFASNSPNGTVRLRYTPVSQVAAASSGSLEYDALNMFAGEISIRAERGSAYKSYPLPGLGSAINSAGQILAETMTDRDSSRSLERSKGSLTEVTQLKLQSQQSDQSLVDIVGSETSAGFTTNAFSIAKDSSQLKSIDDRTVCFDGNCFNNDAGLADWRKNILPYDPSIAFPSYIAPKACQATSMKFINNLDNYVTGPEMILKDKSTAYSGTTQDICWMYSGRNLQSRNPKMSGDGVKTCGYIFDSRIFTNASQDALSPDTDKPVRRIYETTYDPLTGRNITTSRVEYSNWTCKELFDGVANPNDGVEEEAEFKGSTVPGGARLPKCDFDDYEFNLADPKGNIDPKIRSGNCDIPDKYKSCLRYDPQANDQVYIHTEKYTPISRVKIPDVYSAIFGLYDRLQTMLSQRNMKVVLPENIGVKLKINSKIRDANETVNKIDYDYSKQFDTYSTLPQLIDNSMPLASNNSTQTTYQYYDDLGFLDLLQEYIVAYADESTVIGDNVMDNPFVSAGIFNPIQNRTQIVAGGLSNMALGNPILTCDQVEICKNYTYEDLAKTFGADMAIKLCPLKEKLPADARKNCITNISDDRFVDRLGNTLCARGYKVRSGCHFQCSVTNQGGNNSGDNGTIPVILNGQDSILFPVSKDRQIPNCSEPQTVQPVVSDLRVYNDDNDSTISLVPVAKQGLEQMLTAMKSDNPEAYANCAFAWGYRSAERQGAFGDSCTSGTACRCHSEHQLGTSIDFRTVNNPNSPAAFKGSACQRWLATNAYNYGFVQSYTGSDPDYIEEPWHWRYIGIENSKAYKSKESEFGYSRKYLESLQSTANGGGGNASIPGDFKVRYPSDYEQLTGNYGTKGGYATHTGVDVRVGSSGTNIYAAESGIVQYSGPDNENKPNYPCVTDPTSDKYSPLCAQLGLTNIPAYGFMVKILHPNGKVTLYAHNSDLKVKTGDCVSKGQLIALSGSVGNSTGPHSHFEIRKNRTCTWDGNNLGTCTEPPEDYLVSGKGSTSVFTADQVKSVCNGVLPPTDPGTGGDGEEIVCRPTGEDGSGDTGNNGVPTAGGALCLIKRAADSLTRNGIPTNPYMMYAILHQETQSLLDPLSGKQDFICPATWDDWAAALGGGLSSLPKCTGDANQTAFASFNHSNDASGIDVRGLTQFYSATFNETIAANTAQMAACTKDLGVDNSIDSARWSDPKSNYPTEYSRHRVGDALCIQGIKLMNDAKSINGEQYLTVEEWFSKPEIIRSTACIYYGGCEDNYEVNVLRYFNEAVQAKVFDNLDCSGSSTGGDNSGVLSCNINTKASESPDFSKSAASWEAYIKALNLDNNSSYVWFANPNGESQSLKDSLVQKLGSEAAYQQDYNQRLQVTNAFISKAQSLGLNPKFALTLWFEETEFSAIGSKALGCLYFRNGTRAGDIPRDGNAANQIAHLNQQLECLATYINEFPDFRQYMCTYSGEVGRPNCTEFKNNPNFPKNICRFYEWL